MIESATGEMVLLKGMSRGHFSPRAGQDADAALASSHSRCTRRLLLWPAPGPLLRGLLHRDDTGRVLCDSGKRNGCRVGNHGPIRDCPIEGDVKRTFFSP